MLPFTISNSVCTVSHHLILHNYTIQWRTDLVGSSKTSLSAALPRSWTGTPNSQSSRQRRHCVTQRTP